MALAFLLLLFRRCLGVTLLTNSSGFISLTTSSFGVNQWLIVPSPPSSRVLIVITALSLQSLELFIYDSLPFASTGQVVHRKIR